MTEVVWSEKSFKDLKSIYSLIALESKLAAKKVVDSILDRGEQLKTHPISGAVETTLRLKREYRYLVQSHYKIIYRVGKSNIYVVKVFDTRQHPNKINK